jgi:hypothetical protein
MLFALYAVLMTNFFNIFVVIFDTDVTFKPVEIKAKMNKLFIHQKENAKDFYKQYFGYFMACIVVSWFIYAVYYMCQLNGTLNQLGQTYGLYSFGIYMTAVIVTLHHI